MSSAYQVAKPKKSRTVTKDHTRPEADIRATALLCSAFAHLRVFIPHATTVQATVYSHFVPQPQAKSDQ